MCMPCIIVEIWCKRCCCCCCSHKKNDELHNSIAILLELNIEKTKQKLIKKNY